MIDMDPVLKQNCDQIQNLRDSFQQRLQFLEKQAKDLHEKMRVDSEPYWAVIESRLKEMEKLPASFTSQKGSSLMFHSDENAIYIEDEQNPFDSLMRLC